MPRRVLRLSVGGLVLAVESPRPTRALDPPPPLEPFLGSRGGDIRLRLSEDAPPSPDGNPLFDSGGVWRVHRHGDGLLYDFRVLSLKPPVYKAVVIDDGLREGRLHFPGTAGGPTWALDYPLDELLFQHRLAREGAVELHACAVVWRGRAVIFCGQSGAGKSTTARLWRRHTRRTGVLSDDRVVLTRSGADVTAWGTPWHGDGGYASPASAPLAAIFFLRHGKKTRVRPLDRAGAAATLLARSFPPIWDPEVMERVLETCAGITGVTPAFELAFRPDRTAVDVVREVVGPDRPWPMR